MPSSLVSVLIPAYRAEATLAATLDSVLAQSHPDIEIIVVDDGSPDATLAVARSYERHGVTVIAQANAGASAARNVAYRASSGEWIQFLDADDVLAPDKIAVQMARLSTEPDGTVASAEWGWFVGDADPSDATLAMGSDWCDFEPASDWLVHSWQHSQMMMHSAWLIPRVVAEAAGSWNEHLSLNDDGEYNSRVMTVASRIAFCNGSRAYYRVSQTDSLSSRRDPKAVLSLFRSYVLSEMNLLESDDSEAARRAMARRWKEFAFDFYFAEGSRAMVRYALARAGELGGYRLNRSQSRRYNQIQKYLGWRAALHVQRAFNALRPT